MSEQVLPLPLSGGVPWWLKNQKPISPPLKARPIPRDTIIAVRLHKNWFTDLWERKSK